jgi:acyl-CoA thioester hydrolase
MDDSVNMHLLDKGIGQAYPRFVAENGMKYYQPIQFPSYVDVGLRIVKLGKSSVTYDVGIFEENSNQLAAQGKFVHVYIQDEKPHPIPEEVRQVMQPLIVDEST